MMCSPSCAHTGGQLPVRCRAEGLTTGGTLVSGSQSEGRGHLLELGGHPLAVAAPRRVELRQYMLPAVHELIKVVRRWQGEGNRKESQLMLQDLKSLPGGGV